ncbi:MAG: deoxynucleoside kinase [Patescibacteria group bacterium]
MAQFITIAGPQSSGKTTAVNHLRRKHPDWYFLDVVDPYTIGGMQHAGAAYTDRDLQTNIMKVELMKLNAMKNKVNPVFLAEMGIFRLVYARYFYGKGLPDEFFDQYINAYEAFDPYLVFIDTKPEISFHRRKNRYIERIKNRGITDKKKFDKMLKKYQDTVFHLYPYWLKFYDRIRFPKTLIKNSYISEQEFLNEIDKAVNGFVFSSK